MNHYANSNSLTPPPAHLRGLGHTPPPPHIQVHHPGGGAMHTPPPAHMNISDHRSSPGLQLLGHVAASPQLRIHGTPSPHLSVSAHSAGSPAHAGLLSIDRPTSRESYSMTPPRAQVFPHAGVQPELLKVLRPHPPYSSPNTLAIPNNVQSHMATSQSADAALQMALFQQQAAVAAQSSIANQLHQIQYLQAMQQQQQQQQEQAAANDRQQTAALLNSMSRQGRVSSPSAQHLLTAVQQSHNDTRSRGPSPHTHSPYKQHNPHHSSPHLQIASSVPTVYSYNSVIEPPEPSPHHQLKMLANIASSELGILNSEEAESMVRQGKNGAQTDNTAESNNIKQDGGTIYNQRIQNLNNFPTSSPYAASYRSHSIAMQRARAVCITGSAKSLDTLREVMQSNVNVEIQSVIDKYINTYFRPALENIQHNNGVNSAGEEHLQCMCRKMLDEAGKIYTRSRSRSPTPTLPGLDNMSEVGSTTSERPSSKLPFARLKRKTQSDTESEGSTYKKSRKRGRQSGSLGPSGLAKSEPVKRDGPRWNPERLNNESFYIMGSKANKALGLGNARGRIYLKHPELFKYSGDTEDKLWLYENHKMPVTGGKAYMMILEDIQDLSTSAEYKKTFESAHMSGFTIPPWMREKVQKQMKSLRSDSAEASPAPKTKVLTNVSQQEQYDADSDKNVPFKSAASSRKSLSDSKLGMHSPANTEEMELLSSEEQEEPPVSPFGSAEDYAPVSPNNSTPSSLKPPTSPGGTGTGNLVMSLPDSRFGIA